MPGLTVNPGGGAGTGSGVTIADHKGSPRPSRGISPTVPMAPDDDTYSGEGAQAASASKGNRMNFDAAIRRRACYTRSWQ